MNIKEETSTTLTVSTGSLLILIIPIIFIIIGVILIPQLHIIANIPFYFPIIFVGIGVLSLVLAKVSTITFDKAIQTVTIKSTGIFGTQLKVEKLTDVQSITVFERYGNQNTPNGNNSQRIEYEVVLKWNNGQMMTLGNSSQNLGFSIGVLPVGSISKPSIVATAQHIAQFLNIPFYDQEPLSINQAVGAISELVKNSIDNNKQSK